MKKKIIFTVLILIASSLLMVQTYILNFYEGYNKIIESPVINENIISHDETLDNIYENPKALISNISLKDDTYIVNYNFKGEKEEFLRILDEVKKRDERFSINRIEKKLENSTIEIGFTLSYKSP
ncbi:MAG: hypothetical protein MR639_09890 [Clostridium sp.]|uniref:hypothetical protein n=1 Tax=Clostridium sp. TaxID=1506 RepID=UPI002A8968AE|nr:hypothetical protein [Clostridium sp.]MDY5098255.1 hypothetical protein [Clostridium sp.]